MSKKDKNGSARAILETHIYPNEGKESYRLDISGIFADEYPFTQENFNNFASEFVAWCTDGDVELAGELTIKVTPV